MATPLTLEEIETLGELLARIPDNFSAMEPDMLDGFLTALTLMKHPPEQADWLPYVFDSEGNPRAKLADPQQAQLKKLILRRGAEIEATVLAEKPIDPILFDFDEESGEELTGEASLAALTPFADGFAAACALWPELVKNNTQAVQAGLVGIMRWAGKNETADDEKVSEDTEETEAIEDEIDSEVAFADLDEALADVQACVQEIAEVTRALDIARAQRGGTKKHRR